MIQAVIFDMDGVLINSEPLWKSAEIKAFAKIGIEMTVEMCNLTMGFRTNEVIEYWHLRKPWIGKSLKEVEDDLVATVMEEINLQGEIMSGVQQTLENLKNKGIPIALASSSAMQIIDVVVDKLNIRTYFNVIKSAEFEMYGKPHPAVFLSAAEALKVHPTYCLVIEDSINGVIAAKAARMKVIAIPDNGQINDKRFGIADLVLDDMIKFNESILKGISGLIKDN